MSRGHLCPTQKSALPPKQLLPFRMRHLCLPLPKNMCNRGLSLAVLCSGVVGVESVSKHTHTEMGREKRKREEKNGEE